MQVKHSAHQSDLNFFLIYLLLFLLSRREMLDLHCEIQKGTAASLLFAADYFFLQEKSGDLRIAGFQQMAGVGIKFRLHFREHDRLDPFLFQIGRGLLTQFPQSCQRLSIQQPRIDRADQDQHPVAASAEDLYRVQQCLPLTRFIQRDPFPMLDRNAARLIILVRSLVFLFLRDDLPPDRRKRIGQVMLDQITLEVFVLVEIILQMFFPAEEADVTVQQDADLFVEFGLIAGDGAELRQEFRMVDRERFVGAQIVFCGINPQRVEIDQDRPIADRTIEKSCNFGIPFSINSSGL